MELEAINRKQNTAHFIVNGEEFTMSATQLQYLFDRVMGDRNNEGAYRKDLRSLKDEIRAGIHNEILSDPLEKKAVYFYASGLLEYLRAGWFNIAGSAITDTDRQRFNELYISGQQPQEADSDSVKTWFGVYSLKRLMEESPQAY